MPEVKLRPQLNRELVLETALDLVDTEGLAGLNLRRLGRELGASTMAAYTYFENKDALVGAMLGHSLGGLERSLGPAAPWDQQVEQAMLALRGRLVAHPGVAELITSRAEGERLSELRDELVAVVRTTGLGEADTWQALRALMSYVIGFTAFGHDRRADQDAFEYGLALFLDALRARVAG